MNQHRVSIRELVSEKGSVNFFCTVLYITIAAASNILSATNTEYRLVFGCFRPLYEQINMNDNITVTKIIPS